MGPSYNTNPTKPLQNPYKIATNVASFSLLRGKVITHRFFRFDVDRVCRVRLDGFPQNRNGAGNTAGLAALHPPGALTYPLWSQHNAGVAHEVQQ